MDELESRVAALRGSIASGLQALPRSTLEREADDLIDLFYDDIGTIKQISLRSLFDLFLIKVLYLGRGVRDMSMLDYLSDMLTRFLLARELMRFNVRYDFLYSLLEEINDRQRFQNLFEACRQLGDNALFVTGIFPEPRPGRRRRGWHRPRFDRTHFMELGRRYYRLAAEEELAEVVGQRAVLQNLADHFSFYMEALTELSQRYVLGFDMDVIANKMLDAFNRYRQTGDPADMETARKYAALLKIERDFPARRYPRAVPLLDAPPDL